MSDERPTIHPLAHKYSRGVVTVVAGSDKYPGAAVLTVGGARRGGAGYVTFLDIDPRATELVLQRFPDVVPLSSLDEKRCDALVIGPGGARIDSIPHGIPVVLDSGALTSARIKREGITVVTPHEGEIAELGFELVHESNDRDTNRIATAELISQELNVITVLKGHHTVIAAPGCATYVDRSGGPELATAGSGDLLAGLVGALLASWKPHSIEDGFDVVKKGIALHSRAGAMAAKRYTSVTALEIMESLAEA